MLNKVRPPGSGTADVITLIVAVGVFVGSRASTWTVMRRSRHQITCALVGPHTALTDWGREHKHQPSRIKLMPKVRNPNLALGGHSHDRVRLFRLHELVILENEP